MHTTLVFLNLKLYSTVVLEPGKYAIAHCSNVQPSYVLTVQVSAQNTVQQRTFRMSQKPTFSLTGH